MLGITSSDSYIQKKPYLLIPTLTSDNQTPWQTWTNSLYGSGNNAFKAFDNNSGTYWHGAAGTTANIWIGFANQNQKMKIDSIYMLSRSSYANRLPGIWILQGSNDGNIYTDIQQFNTTSIAQSNGNFTVHLDKYYDSYYYYRIYVSSAAGGDCINIATITVYGYFTT